MQRSYKATGSVRFTRWVPIFRSVMIDCDEAHTDGHLADNREAEGSNPSITTNFTWAASRTGIRIACTDKDGVRLSGGPPNFATAYKLAVSLVSSTKTSRALTLK